MTWSFSSLALVAAAAVFVVLGLLYSERIRARLYPPDKFWPYYARKALSTPQLVLYRRLVHAFPEHIVLAQLPLARVLGVKQATYAESWRSRIAGRQLDFVVCLPDATVLAAIELEDSSRAQPLRAGAGHFVDNALAAAGVPLLRFDAATLPSEAELRRLIEGVAAQPAVARSA